MCFSKYVYMYQSIASGMSIATNSYCLKERYKRIPDTLTGVKLIITKNVEHVNKYLREKH